MHLIKDSIWGAPTVCEPLKQGKAQKECGATEAGTQDIHTILLAHEVFQEFWMSTGGGGGGCRKW